MGVSTMSWTTTEGFPRDGPSGVIIRFDGDGSLREFRSMPPWRQPQEVS